MKFELPNLNYDYNALEPYIDANTMEIHHTKHHGGYVTKLNKALDEHSTSFNSIEEIMNNVSELPRAIRNNGGGHYNHTLFWTLIGPGCGGEPGDQLAYALQESFGSIMSFKEKFDQVAATHFGSGWAWLVYQDGRLLVSSTPNQDNPLMNDVAEPGIPLFGLDVWEHAYYLKYQNRRADYIEAIWSLINWKAVNNNYQAALGQE